VAQGFAQRSVCAARIHPFLGIEETLRLTMQMPMRIFAALSISFALGTSNREAVTPVQKVVQMLSGMLEKGKKEKHEEAVQFATYKQFCEDTEVTVKRSIKESDEKIGMLKADIQKYSTEATDLAREIQEAEADVATAEGDKKASMKVRELERVEYEAVHKDYSESIDAIGKAVAVLKKQAFDRAQKSDKSALLQDVIDLKRVPSESKRAIQAFLASDSEEEVLSAAPEANGYEFQSNSIIDMLEKLKDKFVDERSALEKAELSQRHAYDMLQQDLADSITNTQASISTKSQVKSNDQQLVASRTGDLGDAQSTMADDTKYVTDLTSTCTQKSNDFETRQKLRADEIVAVEKAIEILSSDDISGAADRHLPSLLQTSSSSTSSLAQLRSSNDKRPTNQLRMAAYLNDQGKRIGSRKLAMLAVRAAEDPFAKVKKMLQDLITRLEEQAGEETQHKGWCDTELKENEHVRTTRTAAVDKMRSEIDELTASINKEAAEVTQLTTQVAELDGNVAKETEMRQKEKATNEVTIKDAKDAQTAVSRALIVLKEFYATASESTALVQKQQPESPEVFDAPYKGMGATSGGVIGMLEVIQSDFARLESDTTAAEVSQAAAHNKFMSESAVVKAQKKSDITHKSNQKQREEQQLADKNNDLVAEGKELDAANQYFEKLKPSCLDAGMSFEERNARRQEEIQSLQEALRILNGEDIAFLQDS
jgi:hypothetical protein